MLVEKSAEYVVGQPSKRLSRRLGRRREERSGRAHLAQFTNILGSCFGSSFAFSALLGTTPAAIFASLGTSLTVSACGYVWLWSPDYRASKALKLLWGDKLIDPNDVLYRLVLTEEVITYLLAEKANGHENGACKQAVDAFITEFAKYRDTYSKIREQEDAELITEEWEQEHGPLFEHPLVVAIQDAICDNGDLQCHVYDTVMELREERRAKQEAERASRLEVLNAEKEELEKKLELNSAQLNDLDNLNQKCLTA